MHADVAVRGPLAGVRGVLAPDPDDVYTADDMVEQLQRLRGAASGTGRPVSLDRLSTLAAVPRSTLHTYLSGRSWPPPDALDRIVLALGAEPDQARQWACAWERATDLSLAGRYRIGTNGRMSRTIGAVRDRVAPDSASFGRLDEIMAVDQMTIGPLGSPTRLARHLTSRATSDGVDRAFHVIGGRSSEALHGMEIVDPTNCTIGECHVLDDLGVFVAELAFDHALARGESYHYGHAIRYPDDPEAAATEALRLFRRRGGTYALEVRFDHSPPPRRVRQVYRRHPTDTDVVVSDSVQHGDDETYYATVEHASPGLHGLAWDR